MFNLISFIQAAGYLGLFSIIFAESGLLIGFFLPGDSVIFTAGFLASQNLLNIYLLIPLLFVAAVTGDSVGYSFGYRLGPKVFNKETSLFFNKENVNRANEFFQKHGGKTIILARFIPIIRTFAPILAGVGKMRYQTFLAYNLIGGFLWSVGLLLLGFILGNIIPNVDRYLLPIILLIIVISVLPNIIHLLKNKTLRQALIKKIKNIF
jgi:membrane-associated protein